MPFTPGGVTDNIGRVLAERMGRELGQSIIIEPWGRIVAQLDKGEGVVIAEIDPEIIHSVRTRLPALAHRVFS